MVNPGEGRHLAGRLGYGKCRISAVSEEVMARGRRGRTGSAGPDGASQPAEASPAGIPRSCRGRCCRGADHRHCGADERRNREGQGAGGQPTGGRGHGGGGRGRHRTDRRPGTAGRASAAPRRLRRDAGRNRGVCIADAGGSCRPPRRLRRNGQRCTRAADHAGELQPDPAAGRRRPARNGLGYAGLVAHPDGLHLEAARGADDPHLARAADIRAREARHPPDQIHAYPESAVPAHGAAAV